MTQHNTFSVAFAWTVAVATVLLNASSLPALQVGQVVDTDASVVVTVGALEAPQVHTVVEVIPIAGTRTTTSASLAQRDITAPVAASTVSEGRRGAADVPDTNPLSGATPAAGADAISEGDGGQTIDYTYVSRLGRCWWYCTRIPLFCPCVVIWF